MGRGKGLGQLPEVTDQADRAEHSLGLGGAPLPPLGAVAPLEPCLSKRPLRGNGELLAALMPRAEPALQMLFRPKEEHVASGISDVLVPPGRGHLEMNDVVRRSHLPTRDLKFERLVTVGAGPGDRSVDAE